eukprot:4488578-Amphidinium_carterae.1
MEVERWGFRQDIHSAATDVQSMFHDGNYGRGLLHGASAATEAVARKLGSEVTYATLKWDEGKRGGF